MYGKGAGALNVATGVSILPNTGSNRTVFILALSLLVSGIIILAVSTVVARKSRKNEAS
jgi:LPXTG-motif cell wall-anchored protein